MKIEWGKTRKIASQIMGLTGTLPVQIFIRLKRGALVRFTNNGIHQNGFQDILNYQLRLSGSEGAAYVESDDCSATGIKEAIERLRNDISAPWSGNVSKNGGCPQKGGQSPFFDPVPDPSKIPYPKVKEYFPFRMDRVPVMARSAIEQGLRIIRSEQASANGYYSAYERFFYLTNSKGLELFHPSTAVRFGVTIARGGGKGYCSFYHPNPRSLSVPSIIGSAMDLARVASSNEVSIGPGEYECIFSPRAFLELIEPMRHHFDLRLYGEGRSVFSGRLSQRIFSPAFTLMDDVTHRGQFGIPFDADGTARRKTVLVDRGVLNGLLGEGSSTRGFREHPIYPENLVVRGSQVPLTHLFKRIERGVFINKVRYHTLVRETGMTVTGLATAGSLYIEKGKVLGRLGHLRYHDSLLSILGSIATLSKERVLLKDGEFGAALLPYVLISKLRVV